MFERTLEIRSHKGAYRAQFKEGLFSRIAEGGLERKRYIVDAKIAGLYERELSKILNSGQALLIEATEENKSLEKFPEHIERLLALNTRRGDTLVAIGGGIIQDITCFLAATMFRGLDWVFYPTTLLAQADSCIGSKSSINVGDTKNLLGTFTPPKEVYIDPLVLKTLTDPEIRSGIGEMLKVHIIDGSASFDAIAADYEQLLKDDSSLLKYVCRSLEIKKRFIEEDEFDRGIRNVLNYGHSFGHAIEAATGFEVPHGIAVTIGMDMANYLAHRMGTLGTGDFQRMHSTLKKNYSGFENTAVPADEFMSSLSKDKKNTSEKLGLILPDPSGKPQRGYYSKDARLMEICGEYLREGRDS